MEIIKQNESFVLTDTTDVYVMNGNVNREASGTINVYFNVNTVGDEYVGDCHYSAYPENNTVNFGVNCSETNRDELTAYADTVIDSVLEYFNTLD